MTRTAESEIRDFQAGQWMSAMLPTDFPLDRVAMGYPERTRRNSDIQATRWDRLTNRAVIVEAD